MPSVQECALRFPDLAYPLPADEDREVLGHHHARLERGPQGDQARLAVRALVRAGVSAPARDQALCHVTNQPLSGFAVRVLKKWPAGTLKS